MLLRAAESVVGRALSVRYGVSRLDARTAGHPPLSPRACASRRRAEARTRPSLHAVPPANGFAPPDGGPREALPRPEAARQAHRLRPGERPLSRPPPDDRGTAALGERGGPGDQRPRERAPPRDGGARQGAGADAIEGEVEGRSDAKSG